MSAPRLLLLLTIASIAAGCTAAPEASDLALSREGKAVFDQYCAACHAPGMEQPGTMNLALRLGTERGALERRGDLNSDYVKVIVRRGLRLMPAFRPTEVDDRALEAVAAYLTTSDKTNP